MGKWGQDLRAKGCFQSLSLLLSVPGKQETKTPKIENFISKISVWDWDWETGAQPKEPRVGKRVTHSTYRRHNWGGPSLTESPPSYPAAPRSPISPWRSTMAGLGWRPRFGIDFTSLPASASKSFCYLPISPHLPEPAPGPVSGDLTSHRPLPVGREQEEITPSLSFHSV